MIDYGNEKLNQIFRDTWPNLGWAKRMSYDKRYDWGTLNNNLTVKYICTCDFFGGGQFCIHFTESHLIPNRWIRFWTRVFFNSKWNFEND